MAVKPNHTGSVDMLWRDFHRTLHQKLYCMDVDYLLWVEYGSFTGNIRPVAIFEIKGPNAPLCDVKDANRIALVALADLARLPAFGLRHYLPDARFVVTALNKPARLFVAQREEMGKRRLEEFLFEIRLEDKP